MTQHTGRANQSGRESVRACEEEEEVWSSYLTACRAEEVPTSLISMS